MKIKDSMSEKGQSLVLVAILAFAFLAMLAIVLDGAYGYFQRRLAQNAADAGALAGADALCSTEIWSNGLDGAKEIAEYYATEENLADWAEATQFTDKMVKVDASITFNTFFGRILGTEEITAVADATAGCYPPVVLEGVIPVAWSCRKPVVEAYPAPDDPEHEWSSDDCKFLYGDEEYPYSGQIYLIMDGNKLFDDYDTYAACQEPPFDPDCTDPGCVVLDPDLLDCDIDNDGINDIMAGGERSWLDLDGGSANANELVKWINKSATPPIQAHLWLIGSEGNKVPAYQEAYAELVGHDAILPVFNQHCDMNNDPFGAKDLFNTVCYQDFSASEGQSDPRLGDTTSKVYFHVITFAVFHVTCVSDKPSHTCPVKSEAIAANLADPNTFSIEGYFVSGYTPGGGGGPNDNPWVGAYTVYLID